MAPLLQSATTPTDGDAVVTVRGDLDGETAGQLWQYLSYLVGQGHHHIVLDLRGMVLIDSAGVEVLARVSAWTRRKGGELVTGMKGGGCRLRPRIGCWWSPVSRGVRCDRPGQGHPGANAGWAGR